MYRILNQASRRYLDHDANHPFALTVLGTTFYVATQAKHSAEVYKNTETLSFESFVQTLMKTNGNNDRVIDIMYTTLPINKPGFPNPHGESLGVLAQKMHIHQLHPSENLITLQHEVKNWIDSYLRIDVLTAECSSASADGQCVQFSLYEWCSKVFVRMGQYVYFGETLESIDPELPAAFLEFDERIWKMLYQYPGFLSWDMSIPRTQVIASLRRYFQVPRKERIGKIAWLIDAMEDEMRALEIDDDNLAILMFHLYFA
jgi:hypothetical protein